MEETNHTVQSEDDLNALFDCGDQAEIYIKNRNKVIQGYHLKTVIVALLMLILTALSMMLMIRQEKLLSLDALQAELREEVEDVASAVALNFERERIALHAASAAVDASSPRSLARVTQGKRDGISMGAVNFEGSVIAGSTPDSSWDQVLKKAFGGLPSSGYRPGLGYMLVEPVIRNGRISCVIYELISDAALSRIVPGTPRGLGGVQIMINDKVLSSRGMSSLGEKMLRTSEIESAFMHLQNRLKDHSLILQLADFPKHKELLLYVSEIRGTPFYLRGFVESHEHTAPFLTVRYGTLALMMVLAALSVVIMHYLGWSLTHEITRLGRDRFAKVASEIRRRAATAVVKHTAPRIEEIIKKEREIKQSTKEDPSRLEELHQRFEDSAEGLQHTLKSIVDLSGIEKGYFNLNEREYDLKAMLEKQARVVQRKAADKGLNFTLDVDPGLPRVVFGDEQCVSEIIEHLLDNAVRYTSQGSVEFHVTGDLSHLDAETVMLRIKVTDTGSGIEEGLRTRIFRDLPRRMLEEGQSLPGFGLAICRSFLQLMGGFIDVQTSLGKGSTITASVPQKVRSQMVIGSMQLPPLPKKLPQENVAVKLNEIINQGAGIELNNRVSSNSLEQSQEVIPADLSLKRGGGLDVVNAATLRNAPPPPVSSDSGSGSEILDIDSALAGFNHDMTRYLQSCELFCHVADDRRIKIAQAYASADWKRYAMLMCSLKNSAGALGAFGIKTLAAQLESAARIVSSSRSDYIKLRPQGLNFITSRHELCLKHYEDLLKTIHSSLNI